MKAHLPFIAVMMLIPQMEAAYDEIQYGESSVPLARVFDCSDAQYRQNFQAIIWPSSERYMNKGAVQVSNIGRIHDGVFTDLAGYSPSDFESPIGLDGSFRADYSLRLENIPGPVRPVNQPAYPGAMPSPIALGKISCRPHVPPSSSTLEDEGRSGGKNSVDGTQAPVAGGARGN